MPSLSFAPDFNTITTSSLDLGGVLKSAGGDLLSAGVQAGTDLLVSKIQGSATQSGPSGATPLTISAGNVKGLGGLYQFCVQNPPPARTASQGDRGNWVRYAAADVLGIPRTVIYQNNDTKIQGYEYFRAYLAAFDELTNNKYNLLANIPPHSGQCGSTPCSDSPNANPYGVFFTLQQIGAAGLTAIDATWNGQGLDASTQTYITQDAAASNNGDSSSAQTVIDSFLNNLKNAGLSVVQSTLAGAAAGAQSSSAGAAAGAKAGNLSSIASFATSPAGLLVGVVVIVLLFRLLK